MKLNTKYEKQPLKFEEKDGKKNTMIGWLTSFTVHCVVLALLMIPACNQIEERPGYPLPGMQINIGFVDAGSGNEQATSENVSEETPVEEVQEEVPEEAIVNDEKLDNPMESPQEIKKTDVKETKKENTEPVKEKKEAVDPNNTYKGTNKSKSDGNTDKKGDQGKEHGSPDSKNLYDGNKAGKDPGPGGPLGASMDLPGWAWDSKPDKVDPTSENGYVLFEFFVDEDGVVTGVRKLEGSNLLGSEENFYKKQLEKTTFHLKDSRAKPAPRTRGVFRFEIRTK
jgi:hypothetical protein